MTGPIKLGNGGGKTGAMLGPPGIDGVKRRKLGRMGVPSSPGGRFSLLPHIDGSDSVERWVEGDFCIPGDDGLPADDQEVLVETEYGENAREDGVRDDEDSDRLSWERENADRSADGGVAIIRQTTGCMLTGIVETGDLSKRYHPIIPTYPWNCRTWRATSRRWGFRKVMIHRRVPYQ